MNCITITITDGWLLVLQAVLFICTAALAYVAGRNDWR